MNAQKLRIVAHNVVCTIAGGIIAAGAVAQGISIDRDNPRYWNYNDQRILLVGGSAEDNLFQIDNLEEHLDQLVAVGGNYVRNTMSSRDQGNVWPYLQGFSNGGTPVDELSTYHRYKDRLRSWYRHSDSVYPKYNLDIFNETYWEGFRTLLDLTQQRGIIVQIEIWDRFDYGRGPWQENPFNPVNNVNYTTSETGLLPAYPEHPGKNQTVFFRSIPALQMKPEILKYQRSFLNKLLSISLEYDNVLYTISNETSTDEPWSSYWADYLRAAAESAGQTIFITEMWDPWDLNDPMHGRTFDHPERYDFVDVSQNNHQKGQAHWDNLVAQWHRLAVKPRPMNNVKIYGADGGRFSTTKEAIDRFWRSILGGSASARFHRDEQNWGLGLGDIAQAQLRSINKLLERVDLATLEPRSDVLLQREANEAFLAGLADGSAVIYFPDGGSVVLPSEGDRTRTVTWLQVDDAAWHTEQLTVPGGDIRLETPTEKTRWVALVSPAPEAHSQ